MALFLNIYFTHCGQWRTSQIHNSPKCYSKKSPRKQLTVDVCGGLGACSGQGFLQLLCQGLRQGFLQLLCVFWLVCKQLYFLPLSMCTFSD
jgi:hypothetical protein